MACAREQSCLLLPWSFHDHRLAALCSTGCVPCRQDTGNRPARLWTRDGRFWVAVVLASQARRSLTDNAIRNCAIGPDTREWLAQWRESLQPGPYIIQQARHIGGKTRIGKSSACRERLDGCCRRGDLVPQRFQRRQCGYGDEDITFGPITQFNQQRQHARQIVVG